jgi:hypothetical protein
VSDEGLIAHSVVKRVRIANVRKIAPPSQPARLTSMIGAWQHMNAVHMDPAVEAFRQL